MRGPSGARPSHATRPSATGRRRYRVRVGEERGSGSILAVAVLAAVMALTVLTIPVLAVLVVTQTIANAADAAALAAADVASGVVPGVACAAAGQATALNGATLESCEISGAVAEVEVSGSWLDMTVRARARAGPPVGP
ncbi:Rv3654c family TadE-like protein [Luethyella okanaganae]|uniref:Rv3654c family TadE-like protein n=1 Tax=Luethyella okanaganae TaxID=69372 RepID=A0ABW1VAV2_9MICO